MDKSNTRPLLDERELTDEGLVIERVRTDQSLGDLRDQTERETDEKVKSDRQVADNAKAQHRTETDNDTGAPLREDGSDDFLKSNKSQNQPAVEGRLHEQRQSDDEAAGTERLLMDKAIREERAPVGRGA
jgi:hypothetical protein